MNLDTIPETLWDQLATVAMSYRPRSGLPSPDMPVKVFNAVPGRYYDDYEKSSRKLKYVSTGEPDVGWKEKVETMTKTKKEQKVYPKPWVQGDTKSPLEARLGEVYNARPEVARFQFLVKTGGGLNLFNAMQQACRRYINERLQGDTKACVVQMWKVFSESGGMGRSDSCVVYLTEPYTSPSVADLIEYYVWPRVKGLVEMGFVPMGFFKVGGRPLFGVNFAQASAEVQLACLGTIMTESAGQNMGAVLGKAFAFAVEAFTFLKRRHHCRVCGDIFCSDCCQKLGISQIRRPIAPPGGPESGEVYVCDKCRAEVMRIWDLPKSRAISAMRLRMAVSWSVIIPFPDGPGG